MSVEKMAAKYIHEAYITQDLNALNKWIEKFPEGWYWLMHAIEDQPLKDAIERRRWRMAALLLDSPSLPEKIGQLSIATKTPDHQVNWLIEGHINRLSDSQMKFAAFLQERVLW